MASPDGGTCWDVQKPASPRPRRSASSAAISWPRAGGCLRDPVRKRPPLSAKSALPLAPQNQQNHEAPLPPYPGARRLGTFVDDTGVSHTTTKAAPTITPFRRLRATPYLSASFPRRLEHMGVPHAQIIGTYGERCTSGSNLKTYGDGNLWDANGASRRPQRRHARPSHWPTDPLSADEAAMIARRPTSRRRVRASATGARHGNPGEPRS